MLKSEFFTDVRDLLADTPERSSTSNLTYSYDEIRDTAFACRDRLVKMLWQGRRSVRQPFQLTVTSMVKDYSLVGKPTLDVPADFWRLLAGQAADGHYVPAQTDDRAEGYLDMNDDIVTVRAGQFVGTATLVHYVGMPTEDIRDLDEPFTDFPDSFYECLELMTVAELLKKPDRGTLGQLDFLIQEVARAASSLS